MLSQGINIWGGEQFAPLFGAIKRYFTELQSSLSQHYTLALTFAEGETLSIDFATTSTGNEEALLGDNPSAHALLIRTDGKLELVGATTVVFNSVVTDGLLNTFEIVRTGTGVEGFLNGVSDGTGIIAGDITFTRVAGQNGNYFNGIVANLTKDLTHDLAFDEDFGTTSIAVNKGSIGAAGNATAVNITSSELFTQVDDDWLGVELVTNGGFDTNSEWSINAGWSIGAGVATAVNTSVNINQVLDVSVGSSYLVEFDLVVTSGNNILAEIGGSQGAGSSITSRYSQIITPINGSLNLFISGSNFTGTIDNVSVKHLIEVAT